LSDQIIERILTEACFVGSIAISSSLRSRGIGENPEDDSARELEARYKETSFASDVAFRIPPPAGASIDLGWPTIVVPGWIRERAVEIVFEDEGEEEATLPDAILQCVLKVSLHDQSLPF
jgi:actin-related protein 10